MKKLFTSFVALFLLAAMQLNAKTIYFDPAIWDTGGAWFSAWIIGGSQTDTWSKAIKGGMYYEIEVPDDATGMVMVRFSNVATTESWTKVEGESDGYWNQTDDITIGDENLITITAWGQDGAKDSFSQSTYNADEPLPVLEFALIGTLNGASVSTYEEGIKFTQESDLIYTLETKFTEFVEDLEGNLVQKVKLIDADGNIWARNESKTIGTDAHATMTKGQTEGTAHIIIDNLESIYKFTFTLDSQSKGKLTYEIKEGSLDPTDVEETVAELIYAEEGTIIAPAPFAIIDLNGKDVTNSNGSLQGTYIVKTQNSATKISVK